MDERITVDELLDVAEELGFDPDETQDWWKIGDTRGLRVYVKKAGRNGLATEVNLSGFTIESEPLVRCLTEGEARSMKRGFVRGMIEPDIFSAKGRADILRVFRRALDTLVENADLVLRRTRRRINGEGSSEAIEKVTLEPDALEKLLAFHGYGELDAPLWLLGIEEGFGGRLSNPEWSVSMEITARSTWGAVCDAREACVDLKDHYWERRNYSRVWRNAGKLARKILRNEKDWLDTNQAHEYVVDSLGRTSGETFLGELFPLPAVGIHHWPYKNWDDRETYRQKVWPSRLKLWREAIAKSKATTVICYGSDVRPYACELFDAKEKPGTYVHKDGHRTVVFSPFIGGRSGTNKVLETIVEALNDDHSQA